MILNFAWKKTKNNIAPGSSSFTGAFYKAFWSTLKTLVFKPINAIFVSNELPSSLHFGIVNIIPKGSKDQRHLSNWRPLTLLNTLFKLISSILAERHKKQLNRILGPHQKANIPDRFISDATKNCYDTIWLYLRCIRIRWRFQSENGRKFLSWVQKGVNCVGRALWDFL